MEGRQAIEKVLVELVEQEDLTCQQAIDVAEDVFFRNTNVLYGLELDMPELPSSREPKGSRKTAVSQSITFQHI